MIKSLKVILIIANINNPTSNLFENLNIWDYYESYPIFFEKLNKYLYVVERSLWWISTI
jgi:hypothetical protein